jgi:hypothetical protein
MMAATMWLDRLTSTLVFIVVVFALTPPAWAPVLGDCSSEAGLAGRGDVVFCEPWESPTWWRNGYVNSGQLTRPGPVSERDVRYTAIETASCVSGKCLKLRMKQFETTALSIYWPLRNAGLQPEQLYLRYYLKLGPIWNNDNCRNERGTPVQEGHGGKFPGLADIREERDPGGQCGFGGAPGDGIHCWSHRGGFRNCFSGSTGNQICETVPGAITRYYGYVYFVGQEDATGSAALWDSDPWGQSFGRGGTCSREPTNLFCPVGRNRGVLVRERWYALEQFIKMNTPGKADGVIRGWVDGKLAYEKTNMIFRLPGHDNLHVRLAWLDVYKGGVYGNCNDGEIWLDQMVLATDAPIGPMKPRAR